MVNAKTTLNPVLVRRSIALTVLIAGILVTLFPQHKKFLAIEEGTKARFFEGIAYPFHL